MPTVAGVNRLAKIASRLKEQGLGAGARSLARDLGQRVIDRDRTVLLLRVDLTDAAHLLRPRELATIEEQGLRLLPFDESQRQRVIELLEKSEPARIESVRVRLLQGASGFVFERAGEVTGYVFWVPGSDDPRQRVHRDLEWLGIQPAADEVYVFDYFVPEHARGHSGLWVRAVQAEHAALGFRAAYGYVYQANRPALWLYRTTGWKEVGKVVEHRVLNKVALVGGTVYWMHPLSRSRVAALKR